MIDKRKRMLQRFLVRLAKHPRLCHEHLLHRFLDHSVSWVKIRNSFVLDRMAHCLYIL